MKKNNFGIITKIKDKKDKWKRGQITDNDSSKKKYTWFASNTFKFLLSSSIVSTIILPLNVYSCIISFFL